MNLDRKSVAIGAFLGIGFLLAAKYVIVGLGDWNALCCPGRLEPESMKAFFKPFLSGVADCPKCSAFWGQ